jgi:hypothetical protein
MWAKDARQRSRHAATFVTTSQELPMSNHDPFEVSDADLEFVNGGAPTYMACVFHEETPPEGKGRGRRKRRGNGRGKGKSPMPLEPIFTIDV